MDIEAWTRHITSMTKDILDWFGEEPRAADAPDPVRAARLSGKAALPRRFYKEAGVREEEGGYALVLDGRPARTPAKLPLRLPGRAAAEALAQEWNDQREEIDPASMPLTRLANSAIDGVAGRMADVAAETARYARSDLLCYRASDPARLVQRQSDAWDPILDWVRDTFGARFVLAEGVMHVEQPPAAIEAIREAVEAIDDPFALAGLSTVTSLTGSVLLALAVAHGRLSAQEAWAAAHVDEDFQMEVWGYDDEALERRARRFLEMQAASMLLADAG